MSNPLLCERCGRALESDDAVSIIEGVCLTCRAALHGMVQPLRADQLIAGKTTIDENDEFLVPPKPRFRAAQPELALVGEARIAQELRGMETAMAKASAPTASVADRPTVTPNETPTITPGINTTGEKSDRPAVPNRDTSIPPVAPSAPKLESKPTPGQVIQSASAIALPINPKPSMPPRPKSEPKPAVGPGVPTIKNATPSIAPVTSRPTRDATSGGRSVPLKVIENKSNDDEDRFTAAALAAMARAKTGTGSKSRKDDMSDVVQALETSPNRPNAHRYRPPTPPFSSEAAPRFRRRRRDLLIGTLAGLLLTLGTAYYFVRQQTPIDTLPISRARTAPAEIALRISPPFATVKLDGLEVGQADSIGKIIVPLPAGDLDAHMIEISAPGHHASMQPVSTYLGAPDAYIALMRAPYELAVTTEPPEAEVLIDGELRGTSPIKVIVDPSKEPNLAIRRAGFAEITQRIEPPSGDEPLALNFQLIPAGQIMAVTTEPPGATIRVDGQLKGVSPLEIEMPAADLGRTVEISASLDGHDNARMHIQLPEQGGGEAVAASLALPRTLARVNVYTDPPGGRVVIAGKDFGPAPVLVEFDPAETGKSILVEASMGGTHFGRQDVAIPPAGEPSLVMIPMSFGAQRVVFALASPTGSGSDHFALIDQITRQVQSLGSSQRFAIVAVTDRGIESWPGGVAMESATNEQKVRAYDMARAVRPTRNLDLDALLQSTLAFEPTTVWLFIEGPLDQAALERFGSDADARAMSVNLIRATPPADEGWCSQWTSAHRGTFALLGRDMLPTLAADSAAGESDPRDE